MPRRNWFNRASGFEDFRDRFMEQSLAFSLHPFCTVTVVLNNGFDLTDSTELLDLFCTSESSNDTMGYDGRSDSEVIEIVATQIYYIKPQSTTSAA